MILDNAKDGDPLQANRVTHPIVYFILFLPFGAANGFVVVTLAYLLTQRGINAEVVATIVAAALLPNTWKFLWAPIVDTTLGSKRWYLIGVSLTAVGIVACALMSMASSGLIMTLVFVMSIASTLVGMSIEAIIPRQIPNELKGRAGGWLQAGNLGGQGLGGGAGLWMAQHWHAPWISGTVLGTACVLCALPLLRMTEPSIYPDRSIATVRRIGMLQDQFARLMGVLKALWQLVSSRRGFVALLVVFLPIGTGAASNLWAAVAGGWKASPDTVALINGVLGGLASIPGCLIGGYLCDRLDRKNAYILFGVVQALCAVAMAITPHTQEMYVVFVLVYAVTNGMTYAGFSAVALESIGLTACATNYNVFASLSNVPILYMGLVDGWMYTDFGATRMLLVEAGFAVVSIGLFAAVMAVTARRANPATNIELA